MNNKRFQRVRRRLFALNPYCPRCGVLMILPEDIPDYKPGVKKNVPDNMCTYDHKYPKISQLRYGTPSNQNGILCKACNELKGREDELKYLGIEGIKLNSQRG